MMGTKMRVAPEDIAPGDMTTFTGYRLAADVTPVLQTQGRGSKKREWISDVVISRQDGTQDKLIVGAFDPKTGDPLTYTVYRLEPTA